MPDVSPTRWHLAHTTWFFETFVLKQLPGYEVYDRHFEVLFNSYYNSVGQQFPRDRRGQISRPGLAETIQYRESVDRGLEELLRAERLDIAQLAVIELGLNHEQQHQELMLTDIKHVLFGNPLFPIYDDSLSLDVGGNASDGAKLEPLRYTEFPGGEVAIGTQPSLESGQGFCFDNETPRHKALVHPFRLANRCVTNAEYLQFIQAGGYQRPEFWLSLGWQTVQAEGWRHPLYWLPEPDGPWSQFTLRGVTPLRMDEPVCHVSYFEADAYARWAEARLPTEFEWEAAMCSEPHVRAVRTTAGVEAFADCLLQADRSIHPVAEGDSEELAGLGNLWQWTSSQYMAYPGYRPAAGALGEYNGKFMCNQFVLRGGSCATSSDHIRVTYRNFFPPDARWQFTGIRLAND